MSDNAHKPYCKFCGNQMYLTRFQSSVTDKGIDREHAYECLWCGETDKVFSYIPARRDESVTA